MGADGHLKFVGEVHEGPFMVAIPCKKISSLQTIDMKGSKKVFKNMHITCFPDPTKILLARSTWSQLSTNT